MGTAIMTVCLVCGSGDIHQSVSSKTFSYKGESITFDSFISYKCHSCGESFPDEEQLDKIEPKIRDFHREVDGLLTSQEIRSIRRSLGFRQDVFGIILGGGEKAFNRYENGSVTQSKPMDNLLRIIHVIPSAIDIIRNQESTGSVLFFQGKTKTSIAPQATPTQYRISGVAFENEEQFSPYSGVCA